MIFDKFKVVSSLDDLPNFNTIDPVFSDIETDGLYINTRLIQLYQPQTSEFVWILDIDDIDEEEAKAFIKPLWTVWYNSSYDFGTLNMTTQKFDDLFYATRTAYPQFMEFDLGTVVTLMGYDNLYEGLDKKKLQKAAFIKGAYLSNDQLRYAATDVYALSLMWKDENIQAAMNTMAYKVDMLSQGYAIQYQQNGLLVDRKAVHKELGKLVVDLAKNDAILKAVPLPKWWGEPDKLPAWWPKAGYTEENWTGVNCNSYQKVRAALQTNSSDKPTLINIIAEGGDRGKLAAAVFEQRRLIKKQTMLNSYDYDKVYTRFNVAGAVTGRYTATGGDMPTGINSQQINRHLQYIFNKDTEDTVVIEADFGTAELRAAASIMKDHVMYDELMQGIDLHKVSASMATRKKLEEITKADRTKGKAVSFGFIFGMSAATFQEYAFVNYDVVFTLEECQEIKKTYSDHYPGINAYHQAAWNGYKKKNYIVSTALGRRAKPKMGTDAINIPTQGTIAETTKLSIHYCVKEDKRILNYIYNVVHDQINIRVPRAEVDYWRELLVRNMKKGWTEICKTPLMFYKDIPMPVDAEHSAA